MFRPLDIPLFKTNWPIENGHLLGLHDIRVIVHTRPANATWPVPCEVIITGGTSDSITVALASRDDYSVYANTSMTIDGLSGVATGKLVRKTGDIMTVDVIRNTEAMVYHGFLPYKIVPACVIWLPPYVSSFNLGKLPTPGDGWNRTLDKEGRKVIYTADEHIDNGTLTDGRLRMINGISSTDITISADGEGTVVTDPLTNSITITAGERE